ncbi:MAG: HAMP domain-containing histidine kinase [Elusimicrobia bacterium]|nr:HAMP domain-containing histidine kinase [Elusimicrobiota bacterium]
MIAALAFLAGAVFGGAGAWIYARRRLQRVGRLFSFALHEIGTPVTAVNLTVLNLLSEIFGPLSAELKPWVEMTREQMARLNGLVGEVRDFVHMDIHKDLLVASEPASASEIIAGALACITRGMDQAGIELRSQVPTELPALRTDAERASRCLASMLFHARKFRTLGAVTLGARRHDRGVDITVGYEGVAMTPDQAAANLDLYYPATACRGSVLASTGMGLGLLRAVAQRIGGDFDFRVADKGRSELVLTLPADGGS